MKKVKFLIILLLSLSVFTSTVNAAKKKETKKEETPIVVNVYMLTKDGCSGCIAAYDYFESLKEEYNDLFELVPFEVFDKSWEWNSDELQTLFYKTYEYFGIDASSASTPTIIIGDYHSLGLPSDKSLIYNAIINAQKSKVDVMSKIAKDNNLDLDSLKFDYKKAKETTVETKDEKNYDTLIVIGIFVVLIGGFASLIIISKK